MADQKDQERFRDRHMDLIKACRRGDRRAQFEIYRLYHVAMFNTALRIVGDPDDAEDAMQEAFLKAFTRLKTFRGEVSFGAWLKRIVIHKAVDLLRAKREHLSLDDIGAEPASDEEWQEEETIDAGCTADTIRKAILSLPEGYRAVLSLILLEGYDHEEVSQILKISNATSRTQYHRAKKKLVELLKRDHERKERS